MHHDDPWLRLTLTLNKLGYALYLYADHIVWLTKSGFLKADSDKWNKIANKFWLLSIISNLAKDIYEIFEVLKLNKRHSLIPSQLLTNSMTHFNLNMTLNHVFWFVKCHKEIFIDTIRDSCDLFIPLTALGFTKFSPSTVGLFGALSSLAALFTVIQHACDTRFVK